MDRREFLKGTAWMGALAAVSGCAGVRIGCGGTMAGFALRPMGRIRIGVLGCGHRGTSAVHRLAMIPGCEVTAICDRKRERLDENVAWFREKGRRVPRTFCGEEAWKAVCDGDLCDVIYIVTPWALHARQAVRAMRSGKVALVEIPGALTVDECWELVDTCEETRMPCMILENACYGEVELLGLKIAKEGLLGDIVHAEGGYIHDLRRTTCLTDKPGENEWRYYENLRHKGNRYPNHGILPLMQALDVNRGDRFDYLVSLESRQANCEAYIKAVLPKDHPRQEDRLAMGDMNVTLIRTVNGRSIVLNHDISSPRPYSRTNLLSGTKGVFWGMPWRRPGGINDLFQIGFEKAPGEGVHDFLPREEAEKYRVEHGHPLWKAVGELGKKVGGHGGQDFVMDLRWAYCLQNGLPLDLDVYDLAASSCLCELTERSVRSRSAAQDIPDFTRGGWKTAAKLGIVTVDVSKMDLSGVAADKSQIAI